MNEGEGGVIEPFDILWTGSMTIPECIGRVRL